MYFHAYIAKDGRKYSLIGHSIDTLLVALKTNINKRLYTVTCRIIEGDNHRKVIHSYLLLPFLLHDIGKIMTMYQERPAKWNYGYAFHEIVGGILMYRISEEILEDDVAGIDYQMLRYLLVESVKRHHYSMNRGLNELIEAMNRGLIKYVNGVYNVVKRSDLEKYILGIKTCLERYSEIVSHQLNNILDNIIEKALPNMRDTLFSLYTARTLEQKIKKIEDYLRSKNVNEAFIYNAVLTGLISLADYTAASIERSDKLGGYASKFYSRSEIEEITAIIPVECR